MRGLGVQRVVGALCAMSAMAGLAVTPAGATTVTEARYGFSFSLPPQWTQVPLSSALIGKFMRAATKEDPSLEKALGNEVQQATKQHLKFLAIGPVTGSFFPNMNIGVESSPSFAGLSAPTLLPLVQAQVRELLSSAGAHQLKVFTTKVHAASAVEANYGFPLAGPPAHLVQGVQLYIFHGGRLYVVTFTAVTQRQDVATARVVESSWRWV